MLAAELRIAGVGGTAIAVVADTCGKRSAFAGTEHTHVTIGADVLVVTAYRVVRMRTARGGEADVIGARVAVIAGLLVGLPVAIVVDAIADFRSRDARYNA